MGAASSGLCHCETLDGELEAALGTDVFRGSRAGASQPSAAMDEEIIEGCAVAREDGARLNQTKLVFIEMGTSTASGASTTDGASSTSDIGGRARTTAMSMFKTRGRGILSVPPTKPNAGKTERLLALLKRAGVNTSIWGRGGTKTVAHLCWETYEQRGCILTLGQEDHKLKRITRLVKVKLVAEIYGVDHVLFSRMQFMHDGQMVERKQLPLTKLVWTTSVGRDTLVEDESFYEEECPCTEQWRAGCRRTLEERLGLSPSWQSKHLIEDLEGYKYYVDSESTSDGFPGLATTYCVHEVAFRVRDPECVGVQSIGLPQGQEFATAEGDFNFSRQQDENGVGIGTQLNIWTWLREDSMKGTMSSEFSNLRSNRLRAFRSEALRLVGAPSCDACGTAMSPSTMAPVGSVEFGVSRTGSSAAGTIMTTQSVGSLEERLLVRRVPLPQSVLEGRSSSSRSRFNSRGIGDSGRQTSPNSHSSHASSTRHVLSTKLGPPNGELRAAMENKTTNWAVASNIAKRIMQPKYSLKEFYDDLKAFPELDLYLLEDPQTAAGISLLTTGSGRSSGDEYQRTVGAFFAIYWLLRVDIDGMDGFCNGVDERWRPLELTDASDKRVVLPEKRIAFRNGAQWDMIRKLLMDAGLVEERKHRSGMFASSPEKTTLVVNESRLVSLLALTAVHDIMKMSVLLPQVQEAHAPYRGFSAGDTIGDHDQALAYVMEHFPELLPSFRDLSEEEKRCLMFTQCNLCFNHGWFVQAEAPPGAIFTKFRETLIRDHKLEISRRDVALYFVHWLTDLAGAEPTPLAGCEKFATKFPLPVLNSFLRSFETVGRIVSETETQVVEEYLKMRWMEASPPVGPVPTGESAIARMRLLCMAQSTAGLVLDGFDTLLEDDREVLSIEMSRTGCVGQSFSQDLSPGQAALQGPAFLLYYGPAFLQGLGNDQAHARLAVLAEIFRSARDLWPASIAKVNVSVTIRIDMIKSLSIAGIQELPQKGDLWLLVKHNDLEAFVERSSKKKLNSLIASGHEIQVLDFSTVGSRLYIPINTAGL